MRIAVVAHNYHIENLPLQPWRYLYEMVKGFVASKCDVTVITDGYPRFPKSSFVEDTPVVHLRHIKHFPPCNFHNIIKTITGTNPDVILWLTGLTNFFQKRLYKRLGYNIVALVGSPVYSIQELFRTLSATDVARNSKQLMTPFTQAFIPRVLIRDTFNMDSIKAVVTMSKRTKKTLARIGVRTDKLVALPTGVDDFFLQLPLLKEVRETRAKVCGDADNCFLVTFFGPPLIIRGIDTLLRAVKLAIKKSSTSHVRLLILSRKRRRDHKINRYLTRLTAKHGLSDVTRVEQGLLGRQELKVYLSASDLLVLPFKHVVSDVPISIMEGMCLGKPVLSTALDGIPELLGHDRGIIIRPGDYDQLSKFIVHYSENKEELREYSERARHYMLHHPTWNDSADLMLRLLRKIVDN